MEAAAIIIVAVSALAAGALVWGLSWAYVRYVGPAWPALRLAGLGGLAGALIALMVITGWPLSAMRFSAEVPVNAVSPYIEALKPVGRIRPAEDALYERLVTLVQRDREEGRSEDEVRRNAVSQVLSHAADKVASMSDELVRDYYALQRDALSHLEVAGDPATCRDLALGRIRGDIEERLSPELVARQQMLVMAIIRTPSDPNVPRLAQEPFQVLAAQVFALASQSSGVSPNEIETLLSGSGDEDTGAAQKTCRLMKSFFDIILAEPLEVLAPALRAMAAGERGTP
jgi:hypothetical protein